MCGICGILSPAGVSQCDLSAMTEALAHRGPDEHGMLIQGPAGLGHRRLSIIDLGSGRQPITNEDGSIAVVLNGEIYNYAELRRSLIRQGHQFKTESDTEVIVHLYEEHGQNCVTHLRGMFAFALWDHHRRRFFAARDRLGQKPFYYVHRERELLFASEIKALLRVDRSLAKVDRSALDQYLALRIIAPPKSMFHTIRKLPPAHHLTFETNGDLNVERYWDLSYEPKWEQGDAVLIDELEARLLECLKVHLVSDVPVGAFMSGGLDSTLLVAMLMKHGLCDPIETFSIGLPHETFNEAPYARQVADRYGTRHREKTIVPSLLDTLPTLVWHLDEPSDPLALCSYLIAKMAREHVKVVLGGDGGDELFGGYDRYYGYTYSGRYARLPAAIRRQMVGRLLSLLPEGKWYKSRGHQLRWLHRLSFLEGAERYVGSLGYFYFGAEERAQLYGPRMRDASADFDPGAPIRDAFDRADAHGVVDRMLYSDSQIRLPDHSVMILDRMTMAHGLEARSPYMDHELAEFAARLPDRMKVRGRSLRYIQIRLAERYLPAEVLSRPKQGFSSALPYMLREELKLLFGSLLEESHLVRDGYFERPLIERMLGEHVGGRADHGNRLWLLLNSEVWYRQFIEGVSPTEMTERIEADGRRAGLPSPRTGRPVDDGAA